MTDKRNRNGFETRAIHEGQEPDETTGATIVPVYQTVTYTLDAVDRSRGWEYSRSANPTRDALEQCLASLEGGRFALAYASGMAAVHGAMQLLSSGDHVVVADDLYGGSYRLFSQVMPRFGVEFSYVDATRPEEIDKAVNASTRFIWIESPTNPLLQARRHGGLRGDRLAPRREARGGQHLRDARTCSGPLELSAPTSSCTPPRSTSADTRT